MSSSQNRSRAKRVDTRGRLVEDQYLGLVDDCHSERQPLADAERQILSPLVGYGRRDQSAK